MLHSTQMINCGTSESAQWPILLRSQSQSECQCQCECDTSAAIQCSGLVAHWHNAKDDRSVSLLPLYDSLLSFIKRFASDFDSNSYQFKAILISFGSVYQKPYQLRHCSRANRWAQLSEPNGLRMRVRETD